MLNSILESEGFQHYPRRKTTRAEIGVKIYLESDDGKHFLKAVAFNTIHATKQQGRKLLLTNSIFESDGGDACRLAQLGRAARGVY